MSTRPRRSAALRATEAITDMVESEKPTPHSPANRPNSRMSSRQQDRRGSRQSGGGTSNVTRGPPSSPDHLNLNIKVSANKLRQATVGRDGVRTEQQISVNSRDNFVGGEIVAGKRNRGPRKNYVVDSDSDEEDEVEVEMDEGDDDDDDGDQDEDDDEDMDAEGEDMDIDADGEDDDIEIGGGADMDGEPASSITVSRPAPLLKSSPPRPAHRSLYDDDDDDELSDPGPSDIEDTITYGETMLGDDDDAEGEEEIEVAGDEEDAEGEDDDAEGEVDDDAEGEGDDAEGEDDEMEVDSDGNPAGDETPDMDLSKMTRRQRARFEETPQEHMKLSDEVQVKKHFTAEELSMRRAEMARRRRNLSDKRNEEVKMETINKLLKKQAPKTKSRAANPEDTPEDEAPRPDPSVYRWVSDRNGSRLALPEELLASQSGAVLRSGGGGSSGMMGPRKMVEEVQ